MNISMGGAHNLYKYMLGAVKCKKKCQENTPAIVHVDNTARVQTVNEDNGLIFEILNKYKSITSIPILINTSFNDNNEPIVFSHQDALLCFLRTNADFLIIDKKIIHRDQIKNIPEVIKALIEKQSKWIKHYSRKAIEEFTYIGSSKDLVSMKDFLKFNLRLTNASKKDVPILNLIDFLTISAKKRLITDSYHLKIIKKIEMIYPSSNLCDNLEINLVKDEISSLSIIKPEDSVLLYNISFYLNSDILCFYKPHSKILKLDMQSSDSDDNLSSILSSYEVNLNRSIEDLFHDIDN